VADIGSAVAHRLFGAGYNVVLHDEPQPATTRRKMGFADAVFDGVATLEGVEARRASDVVAIRECFAQRLVAVYVGPFQTLVTAFKPDVLVDARMRKRAVPENQRGLATVTVGLGPNFKVGVTCDIAVETSWKQLGVVFQDGAPLALAGEPRELAGHARDRYVYAPHGGTFRTEARIGDDVSAGQPIAAIDETILTTPLGGILRGLTHDGVPVARNTKVIEVDPRGGAAEVIGISERPRRIAAGVMEAIGARA
jgi:xanthine dehydrogenase accessory factor